MHYSVPLRRVGSIQAEIDRHRRQQQHRRHLKYNEKERTATGDRSRRTQRSAVDSSDEKDRILAQRVERWMNHHHHGRHLQSETATMTAANCHNVVYTTEIKIGTPPHSFEVNIDTGSADLWVVSSDCQNCQEIQGARRYDETLSTTYSAPSLDPWQNKFENDQAKGLYAKDLVLLGDGIQINDQVFAQVEDFQQSERCSGEEGSLGLGLDPLASSRYPTVLENLKNILRKPIFSLYLNPTDDYPSWEITGDNGGEWNGAALPDGRHSELLFGGVNYVHYTGCLSWHNVQYGPREFDGFWTLAAETISSGGERISTQKLLVVDSATNFLVGPSEAVGRYAVMNGMTCLVINDNEEFDIVDCDDPDGFDIASIDCDSTGGVAPLQFDIGGRMYSLESEHLIMQADVDNEPTCVLRMLGADQDFDAWILSTAFMSKYYTAFDFETNRVGFAPRTDYDDQEICGRDWSLDINYDGFTRPTTPPVPTFAPVDVSEWFATAEPTAQTDDIALSASSSTSNDKPPAVRVSLIVLFLCGAIMMGLVLYRRRKQKRRMDSRSGSSRGTTAPPAATTNLGPYVDNIETQIEEEYPPRFT